MRVAFDGRLLHRRVTGLERYVWNLLRQFAADKRGNRYEVFLSEDLLSGQDFPDNFESVQVADSKDFVSKAFFDRGSSRPDIYHLTWTGESAADILLLKLLPGVLTVHDLISYENPDHFPNEFLYQRNRKIISMGIRLAKKIIADSDYTGAAVCREFPEASEKVRTVHLACDERFCRIDDRDRIMRIKEKYGIKGKFIFNLGTDFFHKNVKGLILAFERLVETMDVEATLIVAGRRYCAKGSEEIEEVLARSPQRPNIQWIEHLPDEDLCLMYNAADVFAFPSLHEGFGLPVLEAMACGTPVVTSHYTSIPEVAGDATVMVDAKNIEEIADALRGVLTNDDLRESMIEKGFGQAGKFRWEKTAEETLRVYDELYEESRRDSPSDALEPDWREWLDLQLIETEHLERQIRELNESLQLREKHLETVLGSRALGVLRKIKRAVESVRR